MPQPVQAHSKAKQRRIQGGVSRPYFNSPIYQLPHG